MKCPGRISYIYYIKTRKRTAEPVSRQNQKDGEGASSVQGGFLFLDFQAAMPSINVTTTYISVNTVIIALQLNFY